LTSIHRTPQKYTKIHLWLVRSKIFWGGSINDGLNPTIGSFATSQRRRKAAADMGCDIFFDWDSARSVSGKAEREVMGKPDLMGVKNAINHPQNYNFYRWYNVIQTIPKPKWVVYDICFDRMGIEWGQNQDIMGKWWETQIQWMGWFFFSSETMVLPSQSRWLLGVSLGWG